MRGPSQLMDRETADEIKRHFNFVAEGLRSDVRTVAEGQSATDARLDRMETRLSDEIREVRTLIHLSFGDLDRRIKSLETRLGS